jgi:hypothetical protein
VDDIVKGIQASLAKEKNTVLSERIKRDFVWEKVGEKTKQVYEHVLRSE